MKVRFKRTFLKDMERLPPDVRRKVTHLVFDEIPRLDHIRNLKSLRKISGEKDYYRIRHGSYRIGLMRRGDDLVFMRILHRRDIYRYFP
ncbi:MAG: type II toxin-antitoxin system RelE/ParE family toxin [Candidatus Marinimicrobia bacterium]|nr:type II toxin-antitoxin system RelE/ParE family toxin [Candidatus Neomarinimicrobiota bacterium]